MRSVRILAAVVTAAVALLVSPGVAHANKTITASAGSATCSSGQIAVGGKFTLSAAPSSTLHITVNTEVSAIDRSPSSVSGTTNTYDGSFDALLTNKPATASVPDSWNGQFQLASLTCKAPIAPTVSAKASLPGMPPSVNVRVSNPNSILATYQVGAASLGQQTVKVAAGATGEVNFTSATCSTGYQVTVSDNFGTQQSASVTLPACVPGQASPPSQGSPKQVPPPTPAASPTPSDPASATPTGSPAQTDGAFTVPTLADPSVDTIAPHAARPTNQWAWLSNTWTWVGLGTVLLGVVICIVMIVRRGPHDDDTTQTLSP